MRIYPAKGSNQYDSYFKFPKPINDVIYKVLYTDEYFPIDLMLDENSAVKEDWLRMVRPILEIESPEYRKFLIDKKIQLTDSQMKKEPALEDYFIDYIKRMTVKLKKINESKLEEWF